MAWGHGKLQGPEEHRALKLPVPPRRSGEPAQSHGAGGRI